MAVPLERAGASELLSRAMNGRVATGGLNVAVDASANLSSKVPEAALVRRRPLTRAGTLRQRRGLLWRRVRVELRGTVLLIGIDAHEVLSATRIRSRTLVVNTSAGAAISLRATSSEDAAIWVKAIIAAAAAPKSLDDFQVVTGLGRGGGGEVFLVRERLQGTLRAMKVVRKYNAFYSGFALRHAMDERLVLELARECPFVVELVHAFQDDSALFHVTEFCSGGELRTMLRRKPNGRLSPKESLPIFVQIVLALEHVHSLNVIYRDLKPENILLTATGDVRLCDFGLAKVLTTGRYGRTRSFCGSTAYMSPEVVTRRPYGIATDLWSLGALFYKCLVGHAPFDDTRTDVIAPNNNPNEVYQRIRLEEPSYPSWLPAEVTEMLKGLLRKDESERWNLSELKESTFFKNVDWDAELSAGRQRKIIGDPPISDDDALKNFDQDVYKELKVLDDRDRQNTKPIGGNAGIGTAWGAAGARRALSKLSSRGMGARTQSATDIVGFGFSFASDASLPVPHTHRERAEF